MSLLASATYDPAEAVSKSAAALLAMTAIDTTNLRVKFTVPANGAVLVRLKGQVHGGSAFPRILLGVLEGATVKARMTPLGSLLQEAETIQLPQEAVCVVAGLTPGAELTWDAAYGVDGSIASTGLKYGGPNDTAGNDAFGAFAFEVWEAPTLLAAKLYDPAEAVSKSAAALLAMTAIDTTNLRVKFTVPASGKALWRVRTQLHGQALPPGQVLLGVLEGATVKGRCASLLGWVQAISVGLEASDIVTGLTPGAELTWDAAYGVQVTNASGSIKYGGPNDTIKTNAFGAFAFEVWAA